MFDVLTTLALCRRIKVGAPEVWSQFLRFSQKASVEGFIKDEGAFLLSENVGNDHKARVVMRVGGNSSQTQKHYCLDLGGDMDALRALDEDALTELCRSRTRPIITIRSNAAPTLWSLDDALPEDLMPFHADDVRALAAQIRNDTPFMARLGRCAEAAEPVYPPSPYVEDQLYDRLYPPQDDQEIHQEFHRADWPQRASMISRFSDDRSRRLARRLIYMERPDLLGSDTLAAIEKELSRRFAETPVGKMSWRSIPMANDEMVRLLDREMSDTARASQRALAEFLTGRLA
jgi:exodeoxyribonuclease-1